ncbi:MAG: S9 family peptidase, partial [Ignavibacteria bacterium]
MKLLLFLLTVFLINSNSILISQTKYDYPEAKKTEHTDTYFGTEVSDPYSWMEDMQSAELKEWVSEENNFTEAYLSKIPFREKIKERITSLWNYTRYSAPFKAGGYNFFYKNDGLQNQSILYRQKGMDGEPEVFIDPNKLSKNGIVAISMTSVSWDNKYLGYTVSRSGSDWSEIYVMDIETKEKLNDSLAWVRYSGINWYGDGFYYNRFDNVTGDI